MGTNSPENTRSILEKNEEPLQINGFEKTMFWSENGKEWMAKCGFAELIFKMIIQFFALANASRKGSGLQGLRAWIMRFVCDGMCVGRLFRSNYTRVSVAAKTPWAKHMRLQRGMFFTRELPAAFVLPKHNKAAWQNAHTV